MTSELKPVTNHVEFRQVINTGQNRRKAVHLLQTVARQAVACQAVSKSGCCRSYHGWTRESPRARYACDISATWSFSEADCIRGVSELVILHEIMRRVQVHRGLPGRSKLAQAFPL